MKSEKANKISSWSFSVMPAQCLWEQSTLPPPGCCCVWNVALAGNILGGFIHGTCELVYFSVV